MGNAGRWVNVLLVATAVLLLAFHAWLLRDFNAAPPFGAPVLATAPGGFTSSLDYCHVSESKVSVGGWIARRGEARGRHATTVVIRDDADGKLYAMKTDLPLRGDVTKHLNGLFGDRVDYDSTGFAASLNLARAGHRMRRGQVLVAYDTGTGYLLVPLACSFPVGA